ncbi:hypothetical protein A2976_04660 [candidate division WWE3 bacterium RIFCSPLOWO2_01_FULL_41_9]|uniref:Ribosomal RNA methyltransferase n=1 Tax=candidate division WWE3 bacterium RIFCSPLOWO2_01_FULL_41_9 TaxID=1802626 RepID=A0A1F4VG69_UNCKA|nr:MAG: hypothetical protein A2976_04660 [candidate division WWE3 bacterium RIFCSPLOWO2_01_FULL_41_9]
MMLDTFIKEEVDKITSKYKIEQKQVEDLIRSKIDSFEKLIEFINESDDLNKIYRLHDYKEYSKKIKKEIYYSLRRYERSDDNLPYRHVSVTEREPFLDEFNRQLVEKTPGVVNILDIGGGMFPATFPFDKFPGLENYVWVDKDKRSYEELKELNNPKLTLFNESIGTHSWEDYLPQGVEEFDLALMVKLVSVVWRQERDLVDNLTKVPAKTILITAPKEAMTKKQPIYRREKKVLLNFIRLGDLKIVGDLDIENEFGFFIKR